MQQWQFFRIPVKNGADAQAELNRFLRGCKVLAVHREFVAQGENSLWALAEVEGVGKGRIERYGEGVLAVLGFGWWGYLSYLQVNLA